MTAKYIVLNPGSHPAPRWIASAFAQRGELDSYWTGLQFAADDPMLRAVGKFRPEVSNRALPRALSRGYVRRPAAALDALSTGLMAMGFSELRNKLLKPRNQLTGRALERYIRGLMRSGGPLPTLVLPTETASGVESFCRRQSVPYVLYTPLPDAAYCREILEEEAAVNERWSRYLGVIPEAPSFEADLDVSGAEAVVANSSFTALSYSRWDELDVRAVPLAVDLEKLTRLGIRGAALRQRPRLPEEPLKLIYAGQINQRKGLSYLAEAVERVSALIPTELILVGSDSLRMVDMLRRRYPSADIKHVERVAQEELWQLMGTAHVFAFPTILDGFGNALAEAAAIGLPSIVTERCGATDLGLLQSGGARLVPPGDASAIADVLLEWGKDESARARSATLASATMRDGWSWTDYGAAVADYLDARATSGA
ncbi:glycosyltransferase family 4 protein [Microbacterium binotii]|uniref:glycosyltransferase family 4 protein n=1 Tax=Microbacterium binotii TaxID=462710 RepID=UPI001F3D4F36|nr:glycosyltransferase family 4 protein [Microbacterium binotii]UIN30072.1 glycosyltransferase family 4 protein [Microbacterium binotii]